MLRPFSQATLAQGYIPQPRRPINTRVEAEVKQTIELPNGAKYSLISPAYAWGTEDVFGQAVRERDRKGKRTAQ